ncbi:uncharacterized protein LOC119580791 [Penaeus monodon]|uniref:uncharacterized protein LOC119580791 n=1 Tax=Penaeus monodon TaxID=6687 RepID=UPI0018A7B833|nr:uncharacterized protein LOC119580791 [Penaeus monodon]
MTGAEVQTVGFNARALAAHAHQRPRSCSNKKNNNACVSLRVNGDCPMPQADHLTPAGDRLTPMTRPRTPLQEDPLSPQGEPVPAQGEIIPLRDLTLEMAPPLPRQHSRKRQGRQSHDLYD